MTTDSKAARKAAVVAALSVAEAIGQGHMSLDALEDTTIAECRELFGTVHGPDDPLWDMQLDVCRQIHAHGGMTADECAEWTAVQRRREGTPLEAPTVSWIEQALTQMDDDKDDDGATSADV